MSLEIECKYLGVNLHKLSEQLAVAKIPCTDIGFERNLVFETHDNSLLAHGKLLRLRGYYQNNGTSVTLTLKLPHQNSEKCKIRDEREVKVSDLEIMQSILIALGYDVIARYEKIRVKYLLDDVEIALDTLPFGDFVELEGQEKSITVIAKRLGLDKYLTSTKSYHELHVEYLNKMQLPTGDPSFVFTEDQRATLLAKYCLSSVQI